jgi:hypothetical protein
MKVVLNDENVENDYGFKILNKGIDLRRYKNNPIVLYLHNASRLAIGKVSNLKIEDSQLVGDVEWDKEDTDEDVKRLISKYERGYMKGFSVGIRIIELQSNVESTIDEKIATKSELYELSAETLQSNRNAVTVKLMNNDDDLFRLGYNKEQNIFIHKNQESEMEFLKKLAASLGLPDTATEAECEAKIEALKLEVTNLKSGQIESLITLGKSSGLINETNEPHYRKIGGLDYATLKSIVDVAPATPSVLTKVETKEQPKDEDLVTTLRKLKSSGGANDARVSEGREAWSYNDWLEKDNKGLVQLKANAPDKFKALLQKQEDEFDEIDMI